MPWKEMKIVEQRVEFVRAVERDLKSFTALCEDFGISRKTGYKWLNRYMEYEDVDALKDQSRAPDWSALRTSPIVVYQLCELRKKYPHWGAKKLLERIPAKIKEKYKLPAVSSANRILKREGFIKPRKLRRRTPPTIYQAICCRYGSESGLVYRFQRSFQDSKWSKGLSLNNNRCF